MKKESKSQEMTKSKVHIIVEIVQYVPNAVLSKTIIKKTTGNITVTSFDAGEEMEEKLSPYDIYVQVVDGMAMLTIENVVYNLELGKGIIIPAHHRHKFNANKQFKMICTTIKSGYEE